MKSSPTLATTLTSWSTSLPLNAATVVGAVPTPPLAHSSNRVFMWQGGNKPLSLYDYFLTTCNGRISNGS
ncbi:hypothetical protein ABKN59_005005 [Abortiporus biennis]